MIKKQGINWSHYCDSGYGMVISVNQGFFDCKDTDLDFLRIGQQYIASTQFACKHDLNW